MKFRINHYIQYNKNSKVLRQFNIFSLIAKLNILRTIILYNITKLHYILNVKFKSIDSLNHGIKKTK